MERLTKRWGNNPAVPGTFPLDFMFYMRQSQANAFLDFCGRLADYEDTGLTPEQINAIKPVLLTACPLNRLLELAKADMEYRVEILPRPGDVLYETDAAHGVIKHTVTDVHWMANTNAEDDNGITWADYYTDEEMETAHQTREAAEAAMEG